MHFSTNASTRLCLLPENLTHLQQLFFFKTFNPQCWIGWPNGPGFSRRRVDETDRFVGVTLLNRRAPAVGLQPDVSHPRCGAAFFYVRNKLAYNGGSSGS